MRPVLLLLALLPALALGQTPVVEGAAEATVATSVASARVSAALAVGWKYLQCTAKTHYRLGADNTVVALVADMTVPANMAWPIFVTSDVRWMAFILDSSTGSCSVYDSNLQTGNYGSGRRYSWASIDGQDLSPATLTVTGTSYLGTSLGSGQVAIKINEFAQIAGANGAATSNTFQFAGTTALFSQNVSASGTVAATNGGLFDQVQTKTGGATTMSLGTTGTGNVVLGNATSGILTLNTAPNFNGTLQVNGSLSAAASSTNNVSFSGASASNPVTAAANGTNSGWNFTTTGSGVWRLNGVNLPKGPADVYFSAYDSVSTVGTGVVAQGGATATAMTVESCNYTVLTAAVGTGTETLELCSTSGITTGNCTGTKYCTCSLTSGNAARTVVACTVNTAAIAAAVTPTWVATADTIATSDALGNMVAHFTSP